MLEKSDCSWQCFPSELNLHRNLWKQSECLQKNDTSSKAKKGDLDNRRNNTLKGIHGCWLKLLCTETIIIVPVKVNHRNTMATLREKTITRTFSSSATVLYLQSRNLNF